MVNPMKRSASWGVRPSSLKDRRNPPDTGNTFHKRRIAPDFPFIIGALHTIAGGDTNGKE